MNAPCPTYEYVTAHNRVHVAHVVCLHRCPKTHELQARSPTHDSPGILCVYNCFVFRHIKRYMCEMSSLVWHSTALQAIFTCISLMWHESLIRATWCVYRRDMHRSHVWHGYVHVCLCVFVCVCVCLCVFVCVCVYTCVLMVHTDTDIWSNIRTHMLVAGHKRSSKRYAQNAGMCLEHATTPIHVHQKYTHSRTDTCERARTHTHSFSPPLICCPLCSAIQRQ